MTSHSLGRIRPQQKRGGKIACRRFPSPAPAPAACGLPRGGYPERSVLRTAGFSQAACFLIGGIEFGIVLPAITGRPSGQGISAFAAASAAVITGEAATMKNSATTMDRTKIARVPKPETGSNASTGSSKNITFTSRR